MCLAYMQSSCTELLMMSMYICCSRHSRTRRHAEADEKFSVSIFDACRQISTGMCHAYVTHEMMPCEPPPRAPS